MAEQVRRQTYPDMPAKNWWDLRKRFKQAPPGSVTPGYLEGVLDIGLRSAANLMPQLRAMGLIDDDGRLTAAAHDWRTDENYAQACDQVTRKLYPEELLDTYPGPEIDRGRLAQWFSRRVGIGQSKAGQMARFYALLKQADVSAQDSAQAPTERSSPPRREPQPTAKRRSVSVGTPIAVSLAVDPPTAVVPTVRSATMPPVAIAIQVQIAADATPEKIDQLFASIARHLALSSESIATSAAR